jgi:hypothetical protein
MFDKSGQLLCTFSTSKNYKSDIESISEVYNIQGDRVYVLSNVDCHNEIFLTFNGYNTTGRYYKRTISVHRKKNYNILYSINALNELLRLENIEYNHKNVDINWIKYRNSIVTMKDGKLSVIQTKLVSISSV